MSDTLVTVENVSKKFCRKLKRSLWYGMKDMASELVGRNNSHGKLRKEEFWAIKDVSFELKRGECLGLIGRNGAGKSTLLKLLNGLIKPDEGMITMKGRIGALIELGAGFNPILTGRENIYNNAAVLGIPKQRVDRILDDIIDFAEIDEFIDTPVQNYSSGMRVRLGFAVAAFLETDVLLIDEVLAVGDVGFRAKCFNAIYNIIQKSAVIMVSHSMPQVSRVCSDIMVMNHGKSKFQGKDVPKGIDLYYSHFEAEKSIVAGSGKAVIHDVELDSNGKKGIQRVNYLDELSINLCVTIDPRIKYPNIIVSFINQELHKIAQCYSLFNRFTIPNSGERMHIVLSLPRVEFNPGTYSLEIVINSGNYGEVLLKHSGVRKFQVTGDFIGHSPVLLMGEWSIG